MLKKMIIVIASVTVALMGCGKPSEKAAEKAVEAAIEKESGGKAKVDISQGSISVKTDGKDQMEMTSGQNAKVPEDFPKDIPVYAGATVLSSIKAEGSFNINLETADEMSKVTASYKEAMKKEGWTEKTAADMGQMTMLTYAKAEREAMVHINSDGKKTSIGLMYSPGKKDEAPAGEGEKQ